ncbi:hypothetical protein [Streptomyces sp. R08]|uniref:Uncharacterized protein n=1 Tax=Streptomyces sp. R08 TaxID=3238624 RepID=A0AB39MMM3_9ACTN
MTDLAASTPPRGAPTATTPQFSERIVAFIRSRSLPGVTARR